MTEVIVLIRPVIPVPRHRAGAVSDVTERAGAVSAGAPPSGQGAGRGVALKKGTRFCRQSSRACRVGYRVLSAHGAMRL